jgi:putative flippase GtrA
LAWAFFDGIRPRRYMIHSFFRFGVVGVLVFGIDFAALWLFKQFVPRLVALSLAYFLGVSVHFSLNKWWVFRAHANVRGMELVRYVLTVVVCWLCTISVAWLALRFVTNNVFVAKLIAIPLASLLSFLLMRRFVFR